MSEAQLERELHSRGHFIALLNEPAALCNSGGEADDPIGFAGGDTNLYGYVLGDPVNGFDPNGLAVAAADQGEYLDDDPNFNQIDYFAFGGFFHSKKFSFIEGFSSTAWIPGVENRRVMRSPHKGALYAGVIFGILLGSIDGSPEAAAPGLAKGGTYLLRNAEGVVVYTGRTKNLVVRAAQHARDEILGQFEFEVVHRTDSYLQQRGLEQLLYDQFKPALNRIRPISPFNPRMGIYLDAAKIFLGLE